jgi:gallate decarboxylase subunit D
MIVGNDILVVLTGGTAHIGAVAMAEARPSLMDPQKAGATSSVYTYIGHKEDLIAKTMAEKVAKNLSRKVVVVAGIHWDHLKNDEIESIVNMCPEIAEDVIRKLL